MVESRPPTGHIVRFGVFELDRHTGELRKSGLRVGLQDQPLQVLTMLLDQHGELVTRDDLRQRLWPADTFVDFEQGLNAAVKRLRAVLGDSADVPRFIETLPRRGYRWIYPAEPADRIPEPLPVVSQPRSRGTLRMSWLALAAAVLALAPVALTRRKAPPAASGLRVGLLTKLSGGEFDAALSPDGRRIAFCLGTGAEPGLYVKDIGTGQQMRVAEGLAGLSSPTWSPDGREIAFLRHPRSGEERDEIIVVPAAGGAQRKLGTALSSLPGLDWSPDGRLLAFVDKVAPKSPDAIHLLTLGTGERRRLTTPVEASSPDVGDYQPKFSPNGHSVAFVRRGSGAPTSTAVFVHDIGSSDSRAVTSGYGVKDVDWVADGRSLVFVGGRGELGNLWIVDVAGGKARRLHGDGRVGTVSVARGSRTLAVEERVVDVNLWRASGPASLRQEPAQVLFRFPRMDVHPDYSPDGRHIAFASSRKAGLGVSICAEDGRDCVDFKSEDRLARPQWSPDGKSLVAVGWQGEQPLDIVRLEVEGQFARRLTTDNAIDSMPSWSRDGRWLYFASDRSGAFELWKMPSTGGEARQLTRRGGIFGRETADGRWLYFTNTNYGSLWRMPAEGGEATLVLDRQIHQAKWTLWRDSVVYVDESAAEAHQVVMFDPSTRRTTRLVSLERPSGAGLAVSPDGRWILYAQTDQVTSEIMMLEGLH